MASRPGQEQRRAYPRLGLPDEAAATIANVGTARLMNVSAGGALLEHPGLVRPGYRAFLVLPSEEGDLRLACQVAYSSVVRTAPNPQGDRDLIYRTGMQFINLDRVAQNRLSDLLTSYAHGTLPTPQSSPPDPDPRGQT